MTELKKSQAMLDAELNDHFANASDLDPKDGFPKVMFRFAKKSRYRLDALADLVTLAGQKFVEAAKFYGIDPARIPPSTEFFSIFKTFVTSYKVRVLARPVRPLLTYATYRKRVTRMSEQPNGQGRRRRLL